MLSKIAQMRAPVVRHAVKALRAQAPRALSTAARVNENTAPTFTPSILDSIFSKSQMPRVPLTETFPGLPALEEPIPRSVSDNVQVSTLPSGLRVATIASPGAPLATIGVCVDAGSRYETRANSGITQFLESMSLKSTTNRSDFRLVRETLKMGAAIQTSSSRENFLYSSECLPEHVPAIVGTISDLIHNNLFHIEELIEEREHAAKAAASRASLTDLELMEAIHEAAYGAQNVGLPLYAPLSNLPLFTCEALKEYQQTYFTADRMVVTAIGVDHQLFVDLVARAFAQSRPAAAGTIAKTPATYTGGDVRSHKRGEAGLVNVVLAFEGASWHDKDLIPMCVLQTLMGGGGSFSAGGPGKGMYSRLYANVLNKSAWVENASSFMSIFADSGLFGVLGTAPYTHAAELVTVLAKEVQRMGTTIEDAELKRAKSMLKSSMLMQLETRAFRAEDVGRQLLTYGEVQSPSEVCAQIDAVKADDVLRIARRLIKSPVSVAAHGDLAHLQRYEAIQKLLA